MKMHKHDLDLIADFAQGTLDETATAASLVERCEVCRAEFEMQRSMIESLASAPAVHLSEHEKAALHRDIWTELRSDTAATAPSRSGSWSIWAAVGSAAVLLLFVGVLGVFNGIGGSGDAAEPTEEAASPLQGGTDDSAGADGEAADTTTPAAADGDFFGFVSSQSEPDAFANLAGQVRERLADQTLSTPDTADTDEMARQGDACLRDAGLDDHSTLVGFEDRTDLLIALPKGEDPRTAPLTFVDRSTCEVVAVEE